MSKVEFMKSSVPESYSQALQAQNMIFAANYADIIGYTTFAAVGDLLRNIKSLEKPTAFVFRDEANNIIAAAVVKYIESEDPEHPEGNWNYTWSLDGSNIPDGANVTDLSNEMTQMYFVARSGDKYGMEYKKGCLAPMHTIFIKCIREWLTANATADEEAELVLPDIFSARSGIEDNELVMSIEPLGKFVQLIKDDADLEV